MPVRPHLAAYDVALFCPPFPEGCGQEEQIRAYIGGAAEMERVPIRYRRPLLKWSTAFRGACIGQAHTVQAHACIFAVQIIPSGSAPEHSIPLPSAAPRPNQAGVPGGTCSGLSKIQQTLLTCQQFGGWKALPLMRGTRVQGVVAGVRVG